MQPKQLDWDGSGRATTPFAVYLLFEYYGKHYWRIINGSESKEGFATKAEAKAAAQSDFNRRYRECQDAEIRAAVLDMLKIAASDDATIEERQRAVNTILEAMGEL